MPGHCPERSAAGRVRHEHEPVRVLGIGLKHHHAAPLVVVRLVTDRFDVNAADRGKPGRRPQAVLHVRKRVAADDHAEHRAVRKRQLAADGGGQSFGWVECEAIVRLCRCYRGPDEGGDEQCPDQPHRRANLPGHDRRAAAADSRWMRATSSMATGEPCLRASACASSRCVRNSGSRRCASDTSANPSWA